MLFSFSHVTRPVAPSVAPSLYGTLPAGHKGISLPLIYSLMSASVKGSLSRLLFSTANWSIAESICFMLMMQEFACAVFLFLTKFGIAMAASIPIIATTIMISTNVKPAPRFVLSFIILFW